MDTLVCYVCQLYSFTVIRAVTEFFEPCLLRQLSAQSSNVAAVTRAVNPNPQSQRRVRWIAMEYGIHIGAVRVARAQGEIISGLNLKG